MKNYVGLLVLVGMLVLCTTASASVLVAASDAPASIKAVAALVCDGNGDQAEINRAFDLGNDVELSAGTFHTDGTISPRGGTMLRGAGPTQTILCMAGDYGARIDIAHDNIMVQNLAITERGWLMITASHIAVHDVTIRDSKKTAPTVNGMFFVWADGRVCEDIEFVRCQAIDVGSTGFNINGLNSPRTTKNIRFDNCLALRCGNAGSGKIWAVGFDFHEGADLYDLQVLNCRADDNWETGFYFEPCFQSPEDPNQAIPVQQNSYMFGCSASNNGWRNTLDSAFYRSGFYLSEGVKVENCMAYNNFNSGFWVWQCSKNVLLLNCYDQSSDLGFQIRSGENIRLQNCISRDARTYALYAWGGNGQQLEVAVIEPRKEEGYISIGRRIGRDNEDWGCYNSVFNIAVTGASITAPLAANRGDSNQISIKEGAAIPDPIPDMNGTPAVPTTTVTATATPTAIITPTWSSYKYQLELPDSGTYDILLEVSSPTGGTSLTLSVDDGSAFRVNVPNTGTHTQTQTISATANLAEGKHILAIQANGDAKVHGIRVMTPTPVPTVWSTPPPTIVTVATTTTAMPTPTVIPTTVNTTQATPTQTPWWQAATPTVTVTPNLTVPATPSVTQTILPNLTPNPNETYPWLVPVVTVATTTPTVNPTDTGMVTLTSTINPFVTGNELRVIKPEVWVTTPVATLVKPATLTTLITPQVNMTVNNSTVNLTVPAALETYPVKTAVKPIDMTIPLGIVLVLIVGGLVFLRRVLNAEEDPDEDDQERVV